MSSKKQITANQNNSLKATGPITIEGKAIVAQNAVKHGILSNKTPVDDDERIDFQLYASQLYENFEPTTPLESLLVDRIISSSWRLRRIVHIEALMLKNSTKNDWPDKTYKDIFCGYSGQAMAILSRYERTLENSVFRSLQELRNIQEQNKNNLNTTAF